MPLPGAGGEPLPLDGVRVLTVEQYGAGPFASMYLSDLGAEVIKIEPPAGPAAAGGDSSRQSGPYFLGPDDSHFFQTFNLGKKSVTLDLKAPEGREVFHALVKTADAVLNNLRGDQPARLGVDFTTLGAINPRIVCAHLSGYGRTGPRATWPAYDYLMQAEAGFCAVTGEPDGPPTRMGLSMVDYMTGVTCAYALTAGLFGAARTGRGRDLDVSLYDVAMHQLTYPASWYLNEGDAISRRPRSGHPTVVPTEMVPTRDGYLFVMCIQPKFWRRFCALLGRADLTDDDRFATAAARLANRDALAAILDPVLQEHTTAEWMERLAGEVPVAPVLGLAEALDNPFFREQGGVQAVDHPARPGFAVLSNPIRVDGQRLKARSAPALGADTDAVLADAGVGRDEVDRLRAAGIV